jgi:hypothetical protein
MLLNVVATTWRRRRRRRVCEPQTQYQPLHEEEEFFSR